MNKRHTKRPDNDTWPNPFSLIADFEGDVRSLFGPIAEKTLPLLPLRGVVLFPGVISSIMIGRESSRQLIEYVQRTEGLMCIGFQLDPEVEEPTLGDLHSSGVAARIIRCLELPGGNSSVIVQTLGRLHIDRLTRQKPFMRAYVSHVPEELPEEGDQEFDLLTEAMMEQTVKYMKMSEEISGEAVFAVRNISNPIMLVNFVCTNLPFPLEEKLKLFEESDLKRRGYMMMNILHRECQLADLKNTIQQKTKIQLDQKQKEYFLQQQLRNIQDELGDAGEGAETAELRKKAETLQFPPKVREIFEKEMSKLEHYAPQSPDYSTQLTYLQTLVSLPWGKMTEDNLDIYRAEQTLNADHYGLEKVKERILEHLAVLQLRGGLKTPILCLYGPPGVGKTSLGCSIASALGRKYVRISLGGVHDEAEIRGHRRTYIGAMPGRIIKGLQRAETDNPVFILDEIDKVSDNNYNGDPQSALLEVLDPEQNSAFHDNYLDVDYDLSKVFFIATANSLQNIPAPLLDRMELIPVEGYSTEEKREIARRHLVPRLNKEIGFEGADKLKFTPATLEHIIEKYTRESGVRQLEKQLEKAYRKVALLKVEKGCMPFQGTSVKVADVESLLGKPRFSRDRYQGNKYAGVVTGLAWTAVGGEILFIETSLSRSKAPQLTLTGNLGDVMKESAMLALSFIKSHADMLGLDYRIFEQWGVHVHVPEGATPKDGPSAGITIATSLASALTQRKVRPNTAMTGEITLRGRVLPVGGIKEKILAAVRAGITDIIISEENKRDVEEIPEMYRKGMTFHYVENVRDVFQLALLDEKVEHPLNLTIEEKEKKA